MTKETNKHFANLILDEYEQEIEDSIKDGDYFNVSEKEVEEFAQTAKKHNQFKVSKRINIRINNQDLTKVKSKAKRNNIPYQTLIGVLVHKYANGELMMTL